MISRHFPSYCYPLNCFLFVLVYFKQLLVQWLIGCSVTLLLLEEKAMALLDMSISRWQIYQLTNILIGFSISFSRPQQQQLSVVPWQRELNLKPILFTQCF